MTTRFAVDRIDMMNSSEKVSLGILMLLCLAGVSTAQSFDDGGQEVAIDGTEGIVVDAPLLLRGYRDDQSEDPSENAGCSCGGFTCSCCQRFYVKKIGLDKEGCLMVTLLKENLAVRVTLTLGSTTIFSQTASIYNLPSFCAGVPFLAKAASVCVKLNVNVGQGFVSGCPSFVAKLFGKSVATIGLKCFTIRYLESPATGAVGMPYNDDGSHWIRTQADPALRPDFEDNVVAPKMEEISKK